MSGTDNVKVTVRKSFCIRLAIALDIIQVSTSSLSQKSKHYDAGEDRDDRRGRVQMSIPLPFGAGCFVEGVTDRASTRRRASLSQNGRGLCVSRSEGR